MSTACARRSGATWPGAAPAATGSRDTSSCSDRSWRAWKPAGRPGSRCPPRSLSRPPRPGRPGPGTPSGSRPCGRSPATCTRLTRPPPTRSRTGSSLPGSPAGSLTCIPARRPPGSWLQGALASPVLAAGMRTLIGMLASTGIRSGEAFALDAGDLDIAGQVLTVTGKYGRKRLIALHPSAAAALSGYLGFRGQHAAGGKTALLIGQDGRRLNGNTARRVFRSLATACGLEPQPGCSSRDCTTSVTHSRPAPSPTRTARASTWTRA